MNVKKCPVNFSSIVQIGENANKIESESDRKFLKLHRGVIDVTTINLNNITLDLNSKSLQQYSHNDGIEKLRNLIKNKLNIKDHHILITPGGMAALDLLINSLDDEVINLPNYHWGAWDKIITLADKSINTFDDFKLEDSEIENGAILLCFPSNPTGWMPEYNVLEDFVNRHANKGLTVILDLPYYYLYNNWDDKINNLYQLDNVILVSSFSKSFGLSGFRVGFFATKNSDLHANARVRSLYKWNSISTLPQEVICQLLENEEPFENYREITLIDMNKNIEYLSEHGLLFDEYPSKPIGPFAVVNKTFDELFEKDITSVPLDKFFIGDIIGNPSRLSIAVPHSDFKKWFDKFI